MNVNDIESKKKPEVLLLISTHCAHCVAVMQVLTAMLKQGELSALKIINIEQAPGIAQQMAVRSVPWMQLGEFVFEGELTKKEIQEWIIASGSPQGEKDYLIETLSAGKVDQAIGYIKRSPAAITTVAQLMLDVDAKINLKLGIGVIFEEFATDPLIEYVLPQLQTYTEHDDARVRGDACHYLSLTSREEFIPVFEQCLLDDDEDVREIAQESLEALQGSE